MKRRMPVEHKRELAVLKWHGAVLVIVCFDNAHSQLLQISAGQLDVWGIALGYHQLLRPTVPHQEKSLAAAGCNIEARRRFTHQFACAGGIGPWRLFEEHAAIKVGEVPACEGLFLFCLPKFDQFFLVFYHGGLSGQRFRRFSSRVKTRLTSIMEVIGMKTLVESVLILMSPGSLPNQLNSQGANWSATPIRRRIAPRIMNHLAIVLAVPLASQSRPTQGQPCHYIRWGGGALPWRAVGPRTEMEASPWRWFLS